MKSKKYKIVLDSYEGPLDLLLNLIDEAKVDIYDIPINTITTQYMEYIYTMEELNLEIASDFILMAATLLEIKSKMLLPELPGDEDDEEIDPREELVLRLLEYKQYKDAANRLREFERYENKAYYKPKEDLSIYEEEEEFDLSNVDLEAMLKSINNIIAERGLEEEEFDFAAMEKEEFSVKECSANIVDKITSHKNIKFTNLLGAKTSRNEIVTYFLAVLELIKLSMIKVMQNEDFSDLLITRQE